MTRSIALNGRQNGSPLHDRGPSPGDRFGTAVLGAGFGGLATALRLAERGEPVVLYEALNYPGGCASTFERDGYRFEAGATLLSGFGEGQLFREWIDAHDLDVQLEWLDPVIELRTPDLSLSVTRERDDVLQQLCALPGAPVAGLTAFFRQQQRTADVLWGLFEDTGLLPPFASSGWVRHARRAGDYLPLVRLIGSPLERVVASHGLSDFRPLRTLLDATCQITVQCDSREAEALFALAALDYAYRGTAHVRGGIGELAWGLVRAFERAGGEVRMPDRVKGVAREGDGWRVDASRSSARVERVVANLLPQVVDRLLPEEAGSIGALGSLGKAVEGGWGACMLYAVVCPADAGLSDGPVHVQLVRDETAPFREGNHVFVSVSAEDEQDGSPPGMRTMTVSTHVPLDELRELPDAARAERIEAVQASMRTTLRELAPDWYANVVYEKTASPRTFERFTGRPEGLVGGIPRRAGLSNYTRLAPGPVLPGLHLVGDSVFPGQSALATAVGGKKLAERLTKDRQGTEEHAAPPRRSRCG